jgi:probable F420-dependent oxidoreductase
MLLGYNAMNTSLGPRPDNLAEALEARGYESLWIGEHSHIPTSRITPYPAGGDLPEAYTRMLDPFISLAMAAHATTQLRVCTCVTLLLERDIFTTAKEIATLDLLSGGRVGVAVGVGWNEEELANVSSVPWSKRYRALREAVAVLRTIWTNESPEHHGEFYDFDPIWSYPKPVQQPTPPILFGSGGRVGLGHVVEWADGWIPVDLTIPNPRKAIDRMREAAQAIGRDPDEIELSVVVTGDPDPDRLREYRDLGVRRALIGGLRPGMEDTDDTWRFLDRYAPLLAELAD